MTTGPRGAFSRSSSHATTGDMTKASSQARNRMMRIEAKPPRTASSRSARRSPR
jgi:hypothetical protein